MSELSLCSLSTEILISIFSHLDIHNLCKLRETCKRFYEIINTWGHVLLASEGTPLVTNQLDPFFSRRCRSKLTQFDKIRIARNWTNGCYDEMSLLPVSQKFMPWMHLNKDWIWLSRGYRIYKYKRLENDLYIADKPSFIQCSRTRSDITQFQIKNSRLVAGQRDGTITLWAAGEQTISTELPNCHDSDINSVDISADGQIIVSGSRDSTFKVWSPCPELHELCSKTLQDVVWCVCLSDFQPIVSVGTSGNNHKNSIVLYDLERMADTGTELQLERFSYGMLDMRWTDPHTLWSCGYDASLRRWDVRTGDCVQRYEDPCAAALYCMDFDGSFSAVTGTQMHGRVDLWDIRQKHCVQFYFMESCKNIRRNSPVYSIAFDAECLFTATDRNLNVLDFSVYNGRKFDYSAFARRDK